MNVIGSARPRVALVFALLSGLLLLPASQPAIGSAGSEGVVVTVQVEEPEPDCIDSAYAIEFSPSLDEWSQNNPIYIQLPDTSDSATIVLNITEGEDADCNPITGYVTFTESGFEDLDNNRSPVSFLTSEFECGDSLLTPDNNDVFTCDPAEVDFFDVITITVTAGDGARQGYFENTIYLDLYANP